ncbi:MAG: SpoIIE family protein phosphatase [Gemmatimonadales bacterium]|nr:SpoIIE family protein phosphatase [Gemmatimonadales bacterium]NIN12212.1 SpoIIE family protein phosphatase [Gemmatimonadales bacterium]NIN50627.1 SpoIIE family protein phosphatase [Gemmatimonadales bacterium]NIP08091.1 SpoIIE family protein phosphatase [Gemmatimonadales bacterium]NIR03381.1 SpoIIE family protein phosphatase [Gemmatimonadales bacterium]
MVARDDVPPPPVNVDEAGVVSAAESERWIAPVPGVEGYWYEIEEPAGDPMVAGQTLAPLLAQLIDGERDSLALAKQLASRYEEIELLYTISEVLGRTIRLDEAAQTIVSEVSDVVGARRASIFVYDETAEMLRPVAGIGKDVAELSPVGINDPESITSRVFRTGHTVSYDPRHPEEPNPAIGEDRGYRGAAFLSVPILYPGADGMPRPIGVINLTDRLGTDAFSGGERRVVTAVANQIGAAIENARLVERDLIQQRVRRELELAHGLQLKLLPSPDLLGPGVDVAARCVPAHSVGGDFYHFVRLPEGRIGVMLGDVSSHGFSAALVMALVLSAAGIHAEEVASPDVTLRRLLESVEDDLAETEMHLSLFYGVADPVAGVLRYANAGHPHAFRIGATGAPERLQATAPPLGLTDPEAITAAEAPWTSGEDLLLLFSDGIVDARNAEGAKLGEQRVLELATEHRTAPSRDIVEAILAAAADFEAAAKDDRTILALRT